jgi:hypothetical protein
MSKPALSKIAPPTRTVALMGMAGADVLPWKKSVRVCRALRMPPLKLKLAVGLPPVPAEPEAVKTRWTSRVPPSRFTVPLVPALEALRETSSTPQRTRAVPLTLRIPVPRLQR